MGLLESVFQTHCPTWDDRQQLLITPFTSEEHGCILREEGEWRKQGTRLRRNGPPPAQTGDTILRQGQWPHDARLVPKLSQRRGRQKNLGTEREELIRGTTGKYISLRSPQLWGATNSCLMLQAQFQDGRRPSLPATELPQ